MHTTRAPRHPRLSGKDIAGSQNVSPGGAWVTRPELMVAVDATHGPYIQSIRVGDLVAYFEPTSLLLIGLWHVPTSTQHVLGTIADFSYSVSADDLTGVLTLQATMPAFPGITIAITATPINDGFRFTQTITNVNTSYGVESWAFPRLGCKPDDGDTSHARIANGYIGGNTVSNPHSKTIQNTGTPSAMRFWSYFNTETKLHVYVQSSDDVGWLTDWSLTGTSAMALQQWTHYPKNPRRAQNGGTTPQSLTYSIDVILFKGLCADGRMGAFDAALRYRPWATDATRPWMSRGAWATSAAVSSRIKDSWFYYVVQVKTGEAGATYWTSFVTDHNRIASFIGTTSASLMLMYGWGKNQQNPLIGPPNFRPPEFTPLPQAANVNTALGAAAAANAHVSWYVIPHPWDTTLIGSDLFPFSDFEGTLDYGAINQYVIQNQAGAVLTADSVAYFDFANHGASIINIITDQWLYDGTGVHPTAFGYYRQTVNKPRGFYMDLWSGGGQFHNWSPALTPNGIVGTWESAKKVITSSLRDTMRLIDSAFYLTSENTEEDLIPTLDAQHIERGTADQTYGAWTNLYGLVYSRYQCMLDLHITLNDVAFQATPSSQWHFYLAWVVYMWHETGGHICLTNGQDIVVVPTNPPDITNCPLFLMLVGMKRIVDRMNANAALRTYMREGLRMRPMPAEWVGDYIDSGLTLPNYIGTYFGTTAHTCFSLWKNVSTNAIGIVATSISLATETSTIHIEAAAYDLDPTKPYSLFRNVDGVRTELTRFVGTLDYTITLVFDGGGPAVDLYEIVLSI